MIVVANEAQAQMLGEISRLTENIKDELKNIATGVNYANEAIAQGEIMVHTPDITRLTKLTAEHEGLYKAAVFAGIDEENIKLATTLTENGYRRHFTTK